MCGVCVLYVLHGVCAWCGVVSVCMCGAYAYVVCMCFSKDLMNNSYVSLIFETGSYTGSSRQSLA